MVARFRAAIDGGSRGNPGPAAWGVALLDGEGGCPEGHAGTLGRATNNVAEYQGLLHALRWALEQGAESVEVFSDSELLVRQMAGRYRVKNPGLQPLYREALGLMSRFALARITHVRREHNREADALANRALDEQASKLD